MSQTILRIVGSTAGIATLLVAAGYLSLRGHLNYLGIPALGEIGSERIVSESVPLALDLLVHGLFVGISLGVGLLAAIAVCRALRRPIEHLQRRHSDATHYLHRHISLFAVVLFFTSYLTWHRYLYVVIEGSIGIAVGRLDPAKMIAAPRWMWLCQVSAFLLAVFIGLRLVRSRSKGWQGWLAGATGAYLLASSFIVTPLIYGAIARPRIYPTAVVSLDEEGALRCGLLVMATSKLLVLWHAEDEKGWATYLPQSRVRSVITGPPVNIVDLSQRTLEDGQSYPSEAMCRKLTPASGTLP